MTGEMILNPVESRKETELMLECYIGTPTSEEVEEFNGLQKTKVRRFLEKHGGGYGVNINLSQPYRTKPVFKVQ